MAKKKRRVSEHPMQPLVRDRNGTIRFKSNKIIEWIIDANRTSMNELAVMPFSDEDRTQFAQLIGYSVSGFGELSYVPKAVADAADKLAESFP